MQKLIIAAVLASVLATGAVAQDYENSSVVGQVPDRVLVTVKPGVTLNLDKSAGAPRVGVPALDTLAEKYAVRDMEPLYGGLANKLDKAAADIADRVWAIDFDARFDRHDVKAAYERLPEVEEVHLVDICKMYDAFLPDDPGLGSQWFLRNMNLGGGDIRAVPTHCLTQGLGTIMDARHVVLVATGRTKAEAVHQLVEGPVSAMWPATILQHHPHATVLIDDAAARRLQLADYYRETYLCKPAWQGV